MKINKIEKLFNKMKIENRNYLFFFTFLVFDLKKFEYFNLKARQINDVLIFCVCKNKFVFF